MGKPNKGANKNKPTTASGRGEDMTADSNQSHSNVSSN